MPIDDSTRLPVNRDILTRFFEKIRIDPNVTFKGTPCWLWTRQLNKGGYGIFCYHRRFKVREAYRIAYGMFVEPFPVGAHTDTLDHLCRVRACVNPTHLEKVPERINILRGDTFAANHARKTHCPKGHEFTPENIYPLPGKNGKIIGRGCRKCRKYNPARDRERMRLWAREYRKRKSHNDIGARLDPILETVPHGLSD